MDIDPLPTISPLLSHLSFIPCLANTTFGASQITALALAVLCLLVSGFVSGSEMAFFSITDSQREELNEEEKGKSIISLLDRPQQLLATILIANNLVNVTIVVLCNYALGAIFSNMSEVWSFVLQTVILTFLILLFGEILPKLYASHKPVAWAKGAVSALMIIFKILHPFSRILMKSGSIVKRVVEKESNDITTSELSRALKITEGTTGADKEMLEGILKFGNTTASEIMTPRVRLTAVDVAWDYKRVMQTVLDSGYSRMPAYSENQDNIVGMLYSRDLLPYIGKSEDLDWRKLLRKPYFVPESRQIDDLLEDFRRLKIHMAIVVDEFGGTQGVVTLEDVLEEIVGDIDDEYDEPDSNYKRLRDNTYEFEGRTPLTDFFRTTGLDPEDYAPVSEDVETLAGMLLAIKGDFPKDKEPLVYGRCRFLVLEIADHRIDKVRVKVMPDEQ